MAASERTNYTNRLVPHLSEQVPVTQEANKELR
jgi:hypothetical protein